MGMKLSRLFLFLCLLLALQGSSDARQSELQVQLAALMEAAEQGKLETVRELLAQGVPVNGTRGLGTALAASCKESPIEIVELLLKSGADTNLGRISPLTVAANAQRADVVELLLKHGANPNVDWERTVDTRFKTFRTPLVGALREPRSKIADTILPVLNDRQKLLGLIFLEMSGNWREDLIPETIPPDPDRQKLANLAAEVGAPKVLSLLLPLSEGTDSVLELAIANDHVKCAKALLKSGGKLRPDQLFVAVLLSPELVHLVISHGIELEGRDNFQRTPLMLAAKAGHSRAVELLLEAGANPNALDFAKRNALHYGAKSRNRSVVGTLLNAGADSNQSDSRGHTPLHSLGWYGDLSLLREATLGKTDDGWTLLHEWAPIPGATETLLEAGWNRDVQDALGQTALHWCAFRGNAPGVATLLSRGADPMQENFEGFNALELAATGTAYNESTLELLFDQASPSQSQLDQLLCLAIPTKNRNRVSWLLEKGANVQTLDKNGRSPLMLAILSGWKSRHLEVFLERGADVNRIAPSGTPLIYAVWNGRSSVVKWLIQHGAKAGLSDNRGCAPMNVALKIERESLVKLLRNSGAEENRKRVPTLKHPRIVPRLETLETDAWRAFHTSQFKKAKQLAIRGCSLAREERNRLSGFLYLVSLLRENKSHYRLLAFEHSEEKPYEYGQSPRNFLSRIVLRYSAEAPKVTVGKMLQDACLLEGLKNQTKRRFSTLLPYSNWQRERGLFQESLETLEEAYRIAPKEQDKAEARYRSALSAYRAGNISLAITLVGEAEALVELDPNRLIVAGASNGLDHKIWNLLGLLYSAINRYETARTYFELLLKAKHVRPGLIGSAHHNLGLTYLESNPKRALRQILKSEPFLGQSDILSRGIWMSSVARAKLKLHESEEAMKLLTRAIETLEKGGFHSTTAWIYLARCKAHLLLGQPNMAKRDLLMVEKRANGNPDIQAQLETQRGELLLAQDASKERALQHFLTSIKLSEARIRSGLAPQYRSSLLGSTTKTAERALDILIERDPQRAFDLSDRLHSRGLFELLEGPRAENSIPADLAKRITFLEQQLTSLRQHPSSEAGRQVLLRRELTNTLEEIRRRDRVLKATDSNTPPTLREIQSTLTSNEVLIEYFLGQRGSYIWVVKKDSLKTHKIELTLNEFNSQVEAVRDGLRNSQGARAVVVGVEDSGPSPIPHLRELSTALLVPVLNDIEADRRLIIVPHGPLHYLPFGALPLPDSDDPLFTKYSIQCAASAGTWQVGRKQPAGQGRGVALAALGSHQVSWKLPEIPAIYDHSLRGGFAPLPGSAREVESVKRYYSDSKTLLGAQLSKANLLPMMAEAKVVHLATHGILDQQHPIFSGLVLADDLLTLNDISQAKLKADLVVLSACDTGLGKLGKGDDMVGLTRAFQLAGARSVLASLWPVSDRHTAFWMDSFHRQLRAGVLPPEAARQAALDTRAKYPNPRSWAPFVLYGTGE